MKKLKFMSSLSVSLLVCVSGSDFVQSMPRRLTGMKLKSMSSSTLSSSSTSLSRSTSTSSSSLPVQDGGLSSSSSSMSFSSVVQSGADRQEPVVKPKTRMSTLSQLSLDSFETSTSTTLTKSVSGLSSTSDELSVTSQGMIESTEPVNVVTTNQLSLTPNANSSSITRGRALVKDIVPGESFYRPTYYQGVRVEGGKIRPHLVVSNRLREGDPRYSILTTVDMSRAEGKEKSYLGSKLNYLINTSTPGFEGKNSSFVKLNRVREIILPSNKSQRLLGRVVGEEDMRNISKGLIFD